jgi:DNA-binding MarR family transcriptional regulator
MTKGPALAQEAAEIARLLQDVNRRYRDLPVEADIRRSGLTMPQVAALTALFEKGPLSLKDLSRELGLSHSTASGIVDRLERRGLAARTVDEVDRRVTRVSVTDEVAGYVEKGYLEGQLGQLIPALKLATRDQRRLIRDALGLLQSLLVETGGEADRR